MPEIHRGTIESIHSEPYYYYVCINLGCAGVNKLYLALRLLSSSVIEMQPYISMDIYISDLYELRDEPQFIRCLKPKGANLHLLESRIEQSYRHIYSTTMYLSLLKLNISLECFANQIKLNEITLFLDLFLCTRFTSQLVYNPDSASVRSCVKTNCAP